MKIITFATECGKTGVLSEMIYGETFTAYRFNCVVICWRASPKDNEEYPYTELPAFRL